MGNCQGGNNNNKKKQKQKKFLYLDVCYIRQKYQSQMRQEQVQKFLDKNFTLCESKKISEERKMQSLQNQSQNTIYYEESVKNLNQDQKPKNNQKVQYKMVYNVKYLRQQQQWGQLKQDQYQYQDRVGGDELNLEKPVEEKIMMYQLNNKENNTLKRLRQASE